MLVRQGDNYLSHAGLVGKITHKDGDQLANECNYSDLCSDGDAIVHARELPGQAQTGHTLSLYLLSYYNDPSKMANRFKEIAWSVNATDKASANIEFKSPMQWSSLRWFLSGMVDDDVIESCCAALAEFIF